jgi:DNA-binding SARP family transcriptional activator/class 3 adenylate cyclase
MEFRILGPLEVAEGGRLLPVGGGKQRALLSVLIINAGRVVSIDQLIDALWGERPPETAAHTLQVYVSQLRKALGSPDRSGRSVLATQGRGYVLRVEPEAIDLHRFERLVEDGRRALEGGDPRGADRLLRDALALFRGSPLADITFEDVAQAEIARIEDLRTKAEEDRIEANLALGRHGELVGELQAQVARNPLRERIRALLMLALYRSGRQAEALQVYREGRQLLADELGIDPMPELQRLEQAILRQDPSLDAPPREPGAASPAPEPSQSAPRGSRPRRIERKFATALFADIVGSTALAEQEDPEVVHAIMTPAFERLAREIERHGGTIEKYVGDAVLAVFGVPVAHEDDPERAVRAALGVQRTLSELNEELAAEGRTELAIRIGIEAGELLVDLDRVAESRDRMLTGDAVNTAARLQAAAEPGAIVVGPSAYEATRSTVEFRELLPLTLKGKTRPIPAWEVRGITSLPRDERVASGLRARLIGRDGELALLVQAVQRAETERRPALITILGTAGVGKSRLAAELLARIASQPRPVTWRKGRCLAYGNISYSALAQAVRQECGVLEDDQPDEAARKTGRIVRELFGDDSITPMIEALIGSGAERAFSREELFDAWRRFLEKLAARAPLVVQLEDIHWADEGLLDFIDHVADWAEGPLVLLTLARPELLQLRPEWGGGKRNYSAIYLDPLTPDETEAMLEDLLSFSLPGSLKDLVVQRSEGNPLFTEEVVHMLIDRGILHPARGRGWQVTSAPKEVQVPRSIQALIAARLDSLPATEKAVLQDAAVVGRSFWLGITQRLSNRSSQETKEVLGQLRMKEILVPREASSFSGETEFAFRHVLIRDVAYESLPKSMRAEKHIEVARWAEEQVGARKEEIAELLATHYAEALRYRTELGGPHVGDLERQTQRWARAAGERALRLWEHREAARWYRMAAELADRIESPIDERAAGWEWSARAAEAVDPYPSVAAAFERALALYASAGRRADAGRIEAWLAHVAFQSGSEQEVLRWAGRALEDLEPFGDSRDLALALVHLGWYHHRQGRDHEAEPLLRRATEMAERTSDPVVRGRAMLSLGMLTYKSGRSKEGMALLEQALEIARGSRDLPFLLWALLVTSEGMQIVASDYRRAEGLVREGLELARRAGHIEQVAWMQGNLSDYLVDMGRLQEAEEPAREGLKAARASGEPPRIGYSLATLAYLLVLRSELDEAEQLLVELRAIVEQGAETYHEGWGDLIEALIAWARGDDRRATEVLVEGGRRAARRLEPWAGQLLLLECVRSLVRAGRATEAEPFLERLAELAGASLASRAFLAWASGLLEPEPAAAQEMIANAAAQLEKLERRVDHARCLIDLAEIERKGGQDHTATLARAREILESCGAKIFLSEVEGADHVAS